jgi:hypothetical protein
MPVAPDAPEIELHGAVSGLMVGTPMYGGQCFDAYLEGMLDLQDTCRAAHVPLAFARIRNESLIHRGRNRILADFIETGCSHLLFVDADIGFTGRDALRLVAHTTQPNGPRIIGATYAKKNRDYYDPALVALPGPVQVNKAGTVEIQMLPGGFMLLTRDAVLRLMGAHHDDWYWCTAHGGPARRIVDLTACFIDRATRNLLSEDYALCARWRHLGGQVFLDPHILLTHNGTTTFEGDPRSVFINPPVAAPAATAAPAIRVSSAGVRKARSKLGKLGVRK